MATSEFRPLTEEERAQMRQWLENWRIAGPLLDRERWQRLASLTEDEAWRATNELLQMWEPWMAGDAGDGLLLQQTTFARWRTARRDR